MYSSHSDYYESNITKSCPKQDALPPGSNPLKYYFLKYIYVSNKYIEVI